MNFIYMAKVNKMDSEEHVTSKRIPNFYNFTYKLFTDVEYFAKLSVI